jgi:hypothetical protein
MLKEAAAVDKKTKGTVHPPCFPPSRSDLLILHWDVMVTTRPCGIPKAEVALLACGFPVYLMPDDADDVLAGDLRQSTAPRSLDGPEPIRPRAPLDALRCLSPCG